MQDDPTGFQETVLPLQLSDKKQALKHRNHGHRQRLRERMLESNGDALKHDYELLEYLLFGVHRQRDTKDIARDLMARFGSLPGVLNAPVAELKMVNGISEAGAAHIKVALHIARRLTKRELESQPILKSFDKLLEWCQVELAHLRHEEFHIVFLNAKCGLISIEKQGKGTGTRILIEPNHVYERALALKASFVVLVHNHPSGDPSPSKADKELTERLSKTLQDLDIQLIDHLIIGKSGYQSFKEQGLLR